jgi:hypothetical protein
VRHLARGRYSGHRPINRALVEMERKPSRNGGKQNHDQLHWKHPTAWPRLGDVVGYGFTLMNLVLCRCFD